MLAVGNEWPNEFRETLNRRHQGDGPGVQIPGAGAGATALDVADANAKMPYACHR